ncbi:MAG TPA: type II CRISPR RNA-guided endonuclease Cas9, partial [Acholeplasmatales bacterium]|nr:type II CRISPR RNA-guided endonuclease Cas9 [Acholeplasmatales bacterium]
MGKKILGLDIGITSVGWGILNFEGEKIEIIDKGVRIFPEGTTAENEKRRLHRSSRRIKRRRQQRLIDLKALLKRNNIIDGNFKTLNDPYAIRNKGLSQKLTNDELATALFHIVKRRGSCLDVIDDTDAHNESDTKAKKELTLEELTQKGSSKMILDYNGKLLRSRRVFVSQLQFERLKQDGKIRGIENIYKTQDYVTEAEEILKHQKVSTEFTKAVIDLIKRKREYFDGPGSQSSPTPYGQWFFENGQLKHMDMIEKMRGKCTIFKDEPCAPKMSYSADLFNFLNDLNNLDINGRSISTEEKNGIIDQFIKVKGDISPKELADFLGEDLSLISGFRTDKNEKPLLTGFSGYKKLLLAFKEKNHSQMPNFLKNQDFVDKIIEILTRVKGLESRRKELSEIDFNIFDEEKCEILANISGIVGYHSLSKKAFDILIPELIETSDNQMEIMAKSGLLGNRRKNYKGLKEIPADEEAILSPVAKRAQNEALKVINAIRKRYGEMDSIIIETARDKNSLEEKQRINKEQQRGEVLNKQAEEVAGKTELNKKIRQKIRLYMEQDGKCLYSGLSIDLNRLLNEPNAYEIDHIIPISISLDDSFNNKVLVLSDFNALKGNTTPFQFLKSGKARGWSFEEFKSHCQKLRKDHRISDKKLQNFLFEEDITRFSVQKEFIERNLVDTRYASRVILNTLTDYFKANGLSTKIHTVRGSVTSMLRQRAGLHKNRDYFYHHVVDGLLIASIIESKQIDRYLDIYQMESRGINPDTGEIMEVAGEQAIFDPKLFCFLSSLKDIDEAITFRNDIRISHKIDRKPNRQFTDETLYGVRKVEGINYRMGRFKDIYGPEGTTVAKEIRDGKDQKFLMAKNDPATFELLKKIVFNTILYPEKKENNPFAEFKKENGFIKKVSKNNKGPIVKSLKYYFEKLGNHLDITKKYLPKSSETKVVLLQIKPFRTDFYRCKNGKFKFVTIRFSDLKQDKEGLFVDEIWYAQQKAKKGILVDDEFLFSLNRNEYLEICKEDVPGHQAKNLYRFIATNTDQASIIEVKQLYCNVEKEKPQIMVSIGNKIKNIQKFHHDVLGNIYKVEKEVLHLR